MEDRVKVIFETIGKIADRDFQRDVWVRGKYFDRIFNYSEAINTLDDFSYFDGFVESKEFKLNASESLLEEVKSLKNNLEDFISSDSNDKSDVELLIDIEWVGVTEQAKKCHTIWKALPPASSSL